MTRKSFAGAASATSLSASITSNSTTFSVQNAAGYPSGSDPFVIVIGRGTSSEEKVLISDVTGSTFTVASSGRGYDSTIAQAHSANDTVEHCIDAGTIDEANAHVNDTTRDDHTQYLTTTRHDTSARHTFGGAFPAPSAPPSIATSASAGSAAGPARSDHTHAIGSGAINSSGMFGSGVVTIGGALAAPADPADVGTTADDGVATAAARADHVHALGSGVAGSGIGILAGVLYADVENVTTEIVGGQIAVKAAGISATYLAADAVTTAKILDANVTAAKLAASLPRGSLGKAEKTSDQASISGETTVTSLTASVTPETATRKLRVYVACPRIVASSSGVAQTWVIRVKRDGTAIGLLKGTGNQYGILMRCLDNSPTLASHSYTVTLELTGGSGTLTWEGDSSGSSYIEVVDEGGT